MKKSAGPSEKTDKRIPVKEEWLFSKCPHSLEMMCVKWEYYREEIRLWNEKNPHQPAEVPAPYLVMHQFRLKRYGGLKIFSEVYSKIPSKVFELTHEEDNAIVKIPVARCAILPEFKGERSAIAGHIEHMGIKIDWSLPDTSLRKAFDVWLWRYRPDSLSPVKKYGKAAGPQLRADLRALGAYRLLKIYTAEQALEFTEKQCSKPLFAKIPDWYEAKARVKKILEMTASQMKAPPPAKTTRPSEPGLGRF